MDKADGAEKAEGGRTRMEEEDARERERGVAA